MLDPLHELLILPRNTVQVKWKREVSPIPTIPSILPMTDQLMGFSKSGGGGTGLKK